ncbi:MAG: SAM-dependent chlorinase/fluorinase [Acidobacteriota bacterium]
MTRRRGEQETDRRVSVSARPAISSSRNLPIPLVTLLTDFGTADYFVAAMKGSLLSICPAARIVDITHEIPAQDIEAAAFTLLGVYKSFPARTIHLAVVDPGVGSSRRAILVETGSQIFIGPDNGIFSYIYEREPGFKVIKLADQTKSGHAISATFHGRDLFAPLAAQVANGIMPVDSGGEIDNPVTLTSLAPAKLKSGTVKARIIHIDRFGNCITNLTRDYLTPRMIKAGAQLAVNGHTIKSFRTFFAEEDKAELFAIWGSAGFLELAAQNRSAAKILKARRGQSVTLRDVVDTKRFNRAQ